MKIPANITPYYPSNEGVEDSKCEHLNKILKEDKYENTSRNYSILS